MRWLSALFIPGGLLLLAAMIVTRWAPFPGSLSALVQTYPYAVFGTGLFLGWRFHRSQLLFATILLAIADRALLHFPAGEAVAGGVGRTVFQAVALLLPLNLAGLSLMAERGIMTARGLLRLSIILLQLLLVASICRPEGAAVAALLEQPLVDLPPVGVRIAQPALLAFGLAWVTVIARLVWHPNVIQGGFIWALLATFLALHNSRLAPVPTIYLATAGLILVLSVIETSYTLAYRDELTGLRTRRALSEALLKLGRRYTVAMIDVDHFKAFNDQHGHDAGDQLLRMVASRIANMAGGGRVFRYGGEEFTLILPGKSIQEALPHLETLRRAVEATPFILRDSNRPLKRPRRRRSNDSPKQAVSVTISIGVAERTGEQVDPEEVIKAADQALYRAKKSGRNTLSV